MSKKKRITLGQRLTQLEHAFANLSQVVGRHHMIFQEVAEEHKKKMEGEMEKSGIIVEEKKDDS